MTILTDGAKEWSCMNSEKRRMSQRRARIAVVSFSVLVLTALVYLTANVSLMSDTDEKIDSFIQKDE